MEIFFKTMSNASLRRLHDCCGFHIIVIASSLHAAEKPWSKARSTYITNILSQDIHCSLKEEFTTAPTISGSQAFALLAHERERVVITRITTKQLWLIPIHYSGSGKAKKYWQTCLLKILCRTCHSQWSRNICLSLF